MMRLPLFAVLVVVPVALGADPEPKAKPTIPREIRVEGLRGGDGALEMTRITSREEAEKSLGLEKGALEKVLKQVDLKRECLVLLRWAGSRLDRIEMKAEKGLVTFTRIHGKGDDDGFRARLFAVPRKYKLEVR